jgi:N-acetyl-gamma-glutamylphosphate reductase
MCKKNNSKKIKNYDYYRNNRWFRIYSREIHQNLMFHPHATIDFVYSTTNAGKPLSFAHHDLMGDIEMNFTDTVNPNVNVVFLCLGHGNQNHFRTKSICKSY